MQRFKKIIKIVAAIMVFVNLFSFVQDVFVSVDDDRTYKRINGFYASPEGSLDAVFVGSSATYTSWVAPYVWREYGAAVWPYASENQPIQAAKYIIEEVRKTQPDAVFVINISAINGNVKKQWLHMLFDRMPLSFTKVKAVNCICDSYEFEFEDKLELLFPLIKFHDRWSEISVEDFYTPIIEYKSGNHYWSFLNKSRDIGSIGVLDENLFEPLSDDVTESIRDLVEYIHKNDIKVQFVVVPQKISDTQKVGTLNSAVKLVEECGFDVLDMRTNYADVGMDFAVDFYNDGHMNMHGALKTSTYLAEHLIKNYDFEDKRGNPDYKDWDEAYMRYYYECLEPNLIEADKQYFNAPVPSKNEWEALPKTE